MLFIIVCAIVAIAALLGVACISLLDQRDMLRVEVNEYRGAYANERQTRLDYERTIADQTCHLIEVCQERTRLRAERDDALGKLGALGSLVNTGERRKWN